MTSLLLQAVIILGAAIFAVPVARRFGLGSVLGYILAGILIAPLLHLFGAHTEEIRHVAEFGVVLMLFLIGLELEPKKLWNMRAHLFGLGGLQLILTALAFFLLGLVAGLEWRLGLTIALIISLSSTALVLQSLQERNLLASDGGKASFSVLLLQDISVIPILAFLPFLAMPEMGAAAGDTAIAAGEVAKSHGAGELSLVAGLAGWQTMLVMLASIAVIIIGGQYLARPLFRFAASARQHEIFTAAVLTLVIAAALLMSLVDVSPALGTFLAGVILAGSEFRHELESDIEPFKGLLLGLFFITVGAEINLSLLFSDFFLIMSAVILLVMVKFAVLWLLGFLFRLSGQDRLLFALSLAQAGEFGFVLLGFAVSGHALPQSMAGTLSIIIALSMLVTPILLSLAEKFLMPRFLEKQEAQADEITLQSPVIVVGMGRFGQIINRVLRANGYETVILDLSLDNVRNFNKFGIKTFFGDASDPKLMESAGIASAKLLVVAIGDRDTATRIVAHARKHYPQLHIIARARDRDHVYELYEAGATDIVREMFDSSVRAARYALQSLGRSEDQATRLTETFVKEDIRGIRKLAKLYRPGVPNFENKPYFELAQEIEREIERMMSRDDDTPSDDELSEKS